MSDEARPRRSALFMPASNQRALDKARSLAADVVMIDLEDSIAPAGKDAARAQAVAALKAGGYGRRELVLRANGLETPWGRADLKAASEAAPDAIILPKIATPDDVAAAARAMDEAGLPPSCRLWIMMETPLAMLNARDIAATAQGAAPRLQCLVLGPNDIAKATGASLGGGRFAILPHLAACVAAASAYGLTILDGVYNDFRDLEGFRAECVQGRQLGMDGKTLIHPGQIEVANAEFAPDPAAVAEARAVLAAFELPENRGKGVINLDGRMVELLHAEMARRTVAIADAIAQAGRKARS